MERPQISLVLPVFNEEKRVSSNLQTVYSYLKGRKTSFEIIVVDDGSWDLTTSLITQFSQKKPELRIIRLFKNLGKGAAIREGVRASHGKYILFSDIDLSVPISYAPKFIAKLNSGVDVVIASRRARGSKIKARQNSLRQSLGQGFTKLSIHLLGLEISDVTCGFKGFKATKAKMLFSRSKINRWAFDAEILYLAKKTI